MHIWSETPIADLWRRIRYFRSPANVYNLLSGGIRSRRELLWPSGDALRSRAYDISACIRQADEYYTAAKQAGLATEPMLQFYGAQSLLKACILANDKAVALSDLNYHGLSSRPWTATDAETKERLKDYANNQAIWEIEREFAVTNDGIFPHLCAVAGDTVPAVGQAMYFKDLLRIHPDMSILFRRHYNEPSHCAYLYDDISIKENGRLEIWFESKYELEAMRALIPEFGEGYEVKAKDKNRSGIVSTGTLEKIPDFIKTVKGTVAGTYLVKPNIIGVHSTVVVQYAALYILSNVVRYKPSFWMKVIEGSGTGAASIVEDFINVAKRRLPNDILEIFWNEIFTFGTPGYMD